MNHIPRADLSSRLNRRCRALASGVLLAAGATLTAAFVTLPFALANEPSTPGPPASGSGTDMDAHGPRPHATGSFGSVTQTATCVDGGGTRWRGRSAWGATYTDANGVRRVSNDSTGFTSAAAAATTVDYAVKTYNGAGRLLRTLAEYDRPFDFAGGQRSLVRNPLNAPSAPGKARITVTVGDGNDGYGTCSMTFVQPSGAPVIAAAGDIACAPGYRAGASCRHKSVSDKILADSEVKAVLVLGDAQYNAGTLANFMASYHPTWGRFRAKTRPVPGNHEYGTPAAAGYFDYFGSRAGDRRKGYYAFDVGSWRFYAINSERDTSANGAQLAWLKRDLAANPRKCVAAYWHRPRWSSGSSHGNNPHMAPFFKALYDANAELVLSGHDHNYERFVPLNPAGMRDDARGVVQIVSGLGGKNHYQVAGRSTTAAKDQTSFGYSRLTLHPGQVDISYVPAVGTYKDSSRLTCH